MIFLRLFWNILVRWLHLTLDFHMSIITIQIYILVGWPYICPQSYFCGCWIMLILVRCLTPTPRAYCVYGRVSILLSILSKVYFQSFHPFKKGFLKGFERIFERIFLVTDIYLFGSLNLLFCWLWCYNEYPLHEYVF